MKIETTWSEQISAKDSYSNAVYDIQYTVDGSQLLCGVGNRVLIYDANDGELLHNLKGHRDTVYTIAVSRDGKRIATGGADRTIIIWTNKYEGILKYTHNDAIQCLAYNPVTQQLASATSTDFGLWSPEQKQVNKNKVSSKVLCMSWCNDGQYIALGQINGSVSIRDKIGVEKYKISLNCDDPVWTLCWQPKIIPSSTSLVHSTAMNEVSSDILAVGCWNQTLSYYTLDGQLYGKIRQLNYEPTCITYYNNNEFILISSASDHKVRLYTREGIFLKVIGDTNKWQWCVRARPSFSQLNSKQLTVSTDSGQLLTYTTTQATVHGLYSDRYAHRDTLTDVIIQHLITEQKVRIKCRDYVKKIAIYKCNLAIQLPDRILIYQCDMSNDDMHYKLINKILLTVECNLLVVTSSHLILCHEKKLDLYNFTGQHERTWNLPSVIRYIRVTGGQQLNEGLLIGVKSGTVHQIYINQPLHIKLLQHSSSIRCLDLSCNRTHCAVVDEKNCLSVYDLLNNNTVIYSDINVNSVSYNTESNHTLCYSGNNQLSIKCDNFDVTRQNLYGFVVGFNGNKVYCLNSITIQTIDIPQSISMYRYVDCKQWSAAYTTACLGVTQYDWNQLAATCLYALQLDIAKKCYIHLRDIKHIDLINSIEHQLHNNKQYNTIIALGDINAYDGKYNDAYIQYNKANRVELAVQMYLALKQFPDAIKLIQQHGGANQSIGTYNVSSILEEQAAWLNLINDTKQSIELYWNTGAYHKAIVLMGDHAMYDQLYNKLITLNPNQHINVIQQGYTYIAQSSNTQYIESILLLMNDISTLMERYKSANRFSDIFKLKDRITDPRVLNEIYELYAQYLASTGDIYNAIDTYKYTGNPEKSLQLLNELIESSRSQYQYNDVSYTLYLLAQQQHVCNQSDNAVQSLYLSHIYRAYSYIYHYITHSHTELTQYQLFNISQYLYNELYSMYVNNALPDNILIQNIIYTLLQTSLHLSNYKLVRQLCSRLLTLHCTNKQWKSDVELLSLTVRVEPIANNNDCMPICYRCGHTSTNIINTNTNKSITHDVCQLCQHRYIRSVLTYDILPLVEFTVMNDISDVDAIKYIQHDNSSSAVKQSMSQADTLNLDDTVDTHGSELNDSFYTQMMMIQNTQNNGAIMDTNSSQSSSHNVIVLDKSALLSLPSSQIYICRQVNASYKYFRTVVPDIDLTQCNQCNMIFETDQWLLYTLQHNICPYCKCKVESNDMKQA